MPLISSPIDGSPMREIERYGVKIDICQTSGGIWLDKGELEKIIIMIREEALQDAAAQAGSDDMAFEEGPSARPQGRGREDRSRGRKRDGIFDNLLDIFDM